MTVNTAGPDWRDGFLFVGDQLAIDFVNTWLAPDGGALDLLPDWPALVRWFVAAGLVGKAGAQRLVADWAGTPEADRTVRTLVDFRHEIRTAVSRIAAGRAPAGAVVSTVNRHLSAHPLRMQIRDSAGRLQRAPVLDAARPDDLIAPLADAAARLLVDAEPARVRQCEGCVGYFYDASKGGLRRWCSMRMCGNRAKVARYAERRRQRLTHTPYM